MVQQPSAMVPATLGQFYGGEETTSPQCTVHESRYSTRLLRPTSGKLRKAIYPRRTLQIIERREMGRVPTLYWL